MIEIFTKISLNPPCLKDSRSPGLLKNITNKMSKMILLVTPFIDPLLLLLKTNFFFTVIWGRKNGRSFSGNSVSHSPDVRNKWTDRKDGFIPTRYLEKGILIQWLNVA